MELCLEIYVKDRDLIGNKIRENIYPLPDCKRNAGIFAIVSSVDISPLLEVPTSPFAFLVPKAKENAIMLLFLFFYGRIEKPIRESCSPAVYVFTNIYIPFRYFFP